VIDDAKYFTLDIVEVATAIASFDSNVTEIRLFGSRKYPGKVRSDLDFLVTGPANVSTLVDFRNQSQLYNPLDLWLASGETATSSVNGSWLRIANLNTFELYPNIDPALAQDLHQQTFRTDINYAMSIGLAAGFTPGQTDHLGLTTRLPSVFDSSLVGGAVTLVEAIRNGIEAARHMRNDGHAMLGKGTHPAILTEYDLQNLTELILAPIIPLVREPFTVKCQGIERTADFSFASGRIVLELKMSKSSSELGSAVKDAHGILNCYLDHPGVEVALAVLGIAQGVNFDKNALESWAETRNGRHALVRVVTVPTEVSTRI
jgi:hypothetical protein